MASHPTSHWVAPKFNFNSPQQSEDWKVFYTRAIDYLEALDIDTEEAGDQKTRWKQLKIMFKGKDQETLQSLNDNAIISTDSQRTPWQVLDAISMTIKAKDHYWNFQDKLLSNICQLPYDGIHALNTHIITLISQCKLSHSKTQEMLNLMVLQHAVQYHEARDWIWLQDQSQLTYKALLCHCQLQESAASSSQKAKERGLADLTFLTTVTSSASSIHTDALSTFPRCAKCGYSQPPNKCSPQVKECYNCGSRNHYTILCRCRRTQ